MSFHTTASPTPSAQEAAGNSIAGRRLLNRLSNESLASVNTLLPGYTFSNTDPPPAFVGGASSGSQLNEALPSYSRAHPHSIPSSEDANSTSQIPRSHSNGYEYTFPIRPTKPWATLQLFTRDVVPGNLYAPKGRPKKPHFWGGDPISGVLQLDLESPQTIQEVTVNVKGRLFPPNSDPTHHLFFSHEFLLWNKLSGDPRGSTSPHPTGTAKAKSDSKLIGQYTFPFSFPFPAHFDTSTKSAALITGNGHIAVLREENTLGNAGTAGDSTADATVDPTMQSSSGGGAPDKGKKARWSRIFSPSRGSEGSTTRRSTSTMQADETGSSSTSAITMVSSMPPSFSETSRIPISVQYDLVVRVVHGRFKPDSKLKTPISYAPAFTPSPTPRRRREAYEADALLPGPISDPDGWHSLPWITMNGAFGGSSSARQAKFDTTLFLAKPLSFARGAAIPCYLKLESEDSALLDSVCNPSAPFVRLTRRIQHLVSETVNASSNKSENYDDILSYGLPQEGVPLEYVKVSPVRNADTWRAQDLETHLHEVGVAIWWVPPKDVMQDRYTRYLQGEIHLLVDLPPSTACPIFSIEYFVEVLPFTSGQFEPYSAPVPKGQAVQEQVFASQPVEITTLNRPDEAAPVIFSEPPKPKIRSVDANERAKRDAKILFAESGMI